MCNVHHIKFDAVACSQCLDDDIYIYITLVNTVKPTGHSTVYNIVDLPSSFTNGHSSNDFHYDCS